MAEAKMDCMWNSKRYSPKSNTNRKYSTSWRRRQRGNADMSNSTRSSSAGKKKRKRERKN